MKLFQKILNRSHRVIYKVLQKIKSLMSIQEHDDSFLDINGLISAAKVLGINVVNIDNYVYKFEYKNQIHYITRRLCADVESAFAYKITGNKYLTYELLKDNDFHYLPNYKAYTSYMIKDALEDFKQRNHPVVVKPLDGTSGGLGVVTNIKTNREFLKAAKVALLFCDRFLVENFVRGDNYRLTFYNGELLSAIIRNPATVIGDGKHTIKQLIDIENNTRKIQPSKNALSPINIDYELRQTLKDKSLSLKTIPGKNESVPVRTICNCSTGGETVDVLNMIPQSTIDDCKHVLKTLKVVLGGVDIITSDITKPFSETNAIINEVNTSPGLVFYQPNSYEEEINALPALVLKRLFNIP